MQQQTTGQAIDSNPVIEVRDVWKVFGDRAEEAVACARSEGLTKNEVIERFDCVVGVANASFGVREGEVFCVMGLSGSGKSTLVRHVNRLLEPTAGDVWIHGDNLMRKSDAELRDLRARKIGMVFQNFALLPHRTVRDNVVLPLEVREVPKSERFEVGERMLELVSLDGWGDKYIHELSGGMQQRVGLARALAADPDILLMDEPFSALDPLIRRQLQDQFVDLSRRMTKTTIFITHDLNEAIRLGHRIAIMKDGAIVQIGTPEQIVTNPADDYVADFVAGISRLNLVYARSIMEPLDRHSLKRTDRLDGYPRAGEGDDLNHLIDLAMGSEKPILIEDGSHAPIGIVTKDQLLSSVQGSKPQPPATGSPEYAPADAGAAGPAEDPVAEFTVRNTEYYRREFARLARGTGFAVSFNWAAALLGPVWLGARRMWGLFWPFAAIELFGLVMFARGLWGNIGSEDYERAKNLTALAQARTAEAEQALADGAQNAADLEKLAAHLMAQADQFRAQADAAAAEGSSVALVGAVVLLSIKLVQGVIGNWTLERRYMKWRADRSVAAGLSAGGTIGALALVAFAYGVTVFKYVAPDLPGALARFPAAPNWHADTAVWLDSMFDAITTAGATFFFGITQTLRFLLDALETFLVGTPWPVLATVIVALAWQISGPRVAIFTAAAMAYIGLFGFWEEAMTTVALLGTAALFCIAIGVPLGIWCGKSARVYAVVRPILDLMQTMPAFVYLIPVIAFFGIGKPPGIIATMTFGMPPVIRLTALGIRNVSPSLKEAAVAFGATRGFLLAKVEVPLALPTIMAGINQTTLICLSMVVISSLIGAKGLGQEVLQALQFAAEGQGLLAGIAILLCAMTLDRIVQGRQRKPAAS